VDSQWSAISRSRACGEEAHLGVGEVRALRFAGEDEDGRRRRGKAERRKSGKSGKVEKVEKRKGRKAENRKTGKPENRKISVPLQELNKFLNGTAEWW
jgi:hypothetical protein